MDPATDTTTDKPAAKRGGKMRTLVIVNTTEGERDFPLGKYSAILDGKGSPAHQIRTLRLMPGVNVLDRAVIDQARAELSAEDFEGLERHPDFKRLVDAGVLRLFGSMSEIRSIDRATYAANTADVSVLEKWNAIEADKVVKVAIAARLQQIENQGLAHDDRNVAEIRHRPGKSPTF